MRIWHPGKLTVIHNISSSKEQKLILWVFWKQALQQEPNLSLNPLYVRTVAKHLLWPKLWSCKELVKLCTYACCIYTTQALPDPATMKLSMKWDSFVFFFFLKIAYWKKKKEYYFSWTIHSAFTVNIQNKAPELFMLDQSKHLVSMMCWFRLFLNWSAPRGLPFSSLLPQIKVH